MEICLKRNLNEEDKTKKKLGSLIGDLDINTFPPSFISLYCEDFVSKGKYMVRSQEPPTFNCS